MNGFMRGRRTRTQICRHEYGPGNLSYAHGQSGRNILIDFYCVKCEKCIGSKRLSDLTEEEMGYLRMLRENDEEEGKCR